MKSNLLKMLCFFIFNTVISQNCNTKEIKINYTNGLEIFNICENTFETNFDNEKDYYWYTEFSKIKTTKGGSGGQLLSGDYKFYDENGNLINSQQFKNGLLNGEKKKWDNEGNLLEITKYSKGNSEYTKFRDYAEKGWVEHIGKILQNGWIKNSYNKYNELVANEITNGDNSDMESLRTTTTRYFSSTKKIKEKYTSHLAGYGLVGKYFEFYENGNPKVEGSFYDGKIYTGDLKSGWWKWYKENGELDTQDKYEAKIEYWESGNAKSICSEYFDPKEDTWIKNGKCYFYDKDGNLDDIKEFEWGEEKDSK